MSDWAAVITGFATVVLALITAFYAKRTSDMAKQAEITADVTKQMAAETQRMVEANRELVETNLQMVASMREQVAETRAQREAQVRPVVTFALHPTETGWDGEGEGVDPTKPTITRFQLEVRNVGAGPALNITIESEDPIGNYYEVEESMSPFALGVDQAQTITYSWRDWRPRTRLKGEDQWQVFHNPEAVYEPFIQKYPDGKDEVVRLRQYSDKLMEAPDTFHLTAVYYNVYGRRLRSHVPVIIDKHFIIAWARAVRLGQTTVDDPITRAPGT